MEQKISQLRRDNCEDFEIEAKRLGHDTEREAKEIIDIMSPKNTR